MSAPTAGMTGIGGGHSDPLFTAPQGSAPSYGSSAGMPSYGGKGGMPSYGMSSYGSQMPSYGGKGSAPSYGGKGSGGMNSGMYGGYPYTSSPYGASNYGTGFLNPNTLPMGYGNNIGGWQSPSMTGDGFSWYGGQAPIPEGGTYNQMAQMMAGPSYAPAGSNWTSLTPGQSANFGGASGGKGGSSSGGKGSLGSLPPPNAGQSLSSYGVQTLGNSIPNTGTSGSSVQGSGGITPPSQSPVYPTATTVGSNLNSNNILSLGAKMPYFAGQHYPLGGGYNPLAMYQAMHLP